MCVCVCVLGRKRESEGESVCVCVSVCACVCVCILYMCQNCFGFGVSFNRTESAELEGGVRESSGKITLLDSIRSLRSHLHAQWPALDYCFTGAKTDTHVSVWLLPDR